MRLAVLVVAMMLAAPSAAGATDARILSPANGTNLPLSADGVTVTFTCPPYSDPQLGDSAGYQAGFLFRDREEIVDAVEAPDGTCSAVFRHVARPVGVTWFVRHACGGCLCETCDFVVHADTGPFSEFTAGPDARVLRASLQRRAFAGYPFRIGASITANVPRNTFARLERRVGSRWRSTDVYAYVGDGRGSVDVQRPLGRYELRWTVQFGYQLLHSPVRRLRVVPARHWTTGARADGRYRGGDVRLRVTGAGRTVRGLRGPSVEACDLSPHGTTYPVHVSFDRIPIAPDGRFSTRGEFGRLSGRLLAGVVRGRIDPECDHARSFSAGRS